MLQEAREVVRGLWLEDFHLALSSRYLKEGSVAVLRLQIMRSNKP